MVDKESIILNLDSWFKFRSDVQTHVLFGAHISHSGKDPTIQQFHVKFV